MRGQVTGGNVLFHDPSVTDQQDPQEKYYFLWIKS
jgi:hypothetical protein